MNITAVALTLVAGLQCVMSAGLRVKAPLGGNASVCCPYHRGSESYPKYFSKGRPGERIEIVRVKRLKTWSTDGRFSLEDDQKKKEFTVTIRNINVEDAGLYWCGVDRWGPDDLTKVNLDVLQDILPSSQSSSTQNVRETTLPPSGKQDIKTSITDKLMILGGWLAVALLLCGVMTGIFIKAKRSNIERAATHSAACHRRDKSNRELAVDDYVRMKPVFRNAGSSVNEEDSFSSGPHSHLQLHHTSAAVVSTNSPEIDPIMRLQVQPCVHPDSSDPPICQQSNIYEHLRVESHQDSIYHTLHVTSR